MAHRSVWHGCRRKILCVGCQLYMTPDIAALAYTCPRCKQRVLYRDTEGTLEEAMLDLGRELELWKCQ